MAKLFALVDCNNFYASCERVFNPGLEGKPVIVLSNNDGCVVARSGEAKSLGIKMGIPVFEIREMVKKNNVVVLSSNYSLYGDLSKRVMSVLAGFTPKLEVYSIDEAFLDLSGFSYHNIPQYALLIKNKIMQWTGIPVTLGLAPTKTLAKVASRAGKKNHSGIFIIDDVSDIEPVLANLPVDEVWGIGRKIALKLKSVNIFNAQQLKNIDQNWMRKNFGITGLRTVKELQGISCLALEDVMPPKKIITTSRTFAYPVTSFEGLREAISTFTSNAAEKLRDQSSVTPVVMVFILTNRFNRDKFYYNHRIIELPTPTSNSLILINHAIEGLRQIFKEGYRYKKAGVIFNDLIPYHQVQMNMFDNVNFNKSEKIMKAIDGINFSMGNGSVKFASEGTDKHWVMKFEMRSPCYTTRWKDIPTANCGN